MKKRTDLFPNNNPLLLRLLLSLRLRQLRPLHLPLVESSQVIRSGVEIEIYLFDLVVGRLALLGRWGEERFLRAGVVEYFDFHFRCKNCVLVEVEVLCCDISLETGGDFLYNLTEVAAKFFCGERGRPGVQNRLRLSKLKLNVNFKLHSDRD
jgi:hypothetical protein